MNGLNARIDRLASQLRDSLEAGLGAICIIPDNGRDPVLPLSQYASAMVVIVPPEVDRSDPDWLNRFLEVNSDEPEVED